MNYLFRQLAFARSNTINAVAELEEEQAEVIARGFNNHIKWHLGHIYFVQERFAFSFIGEEITLPERLAELFAPGTRPSEWKGPVPSVGELTDLLQAQHNKLVSVLNHRLAEQLPTPYTTSTGLTNATVEECLSFCLYHEGMHLDAIKALKRLVG